MLYVDTSALAKTVLAEVESAALLGLLDGQDASRLWTSALTVTELLRAAARHSEEHVSAARDSLQRLFLVTLTADLLETAGTLAPAGMRSLDAVHLATALQLGQELEGLVTYDERMAEAAEHHGLTVLAPR